MLVGQKLLMLGDGQLSVYDVESGDVVDSFDTMPLSNVLTTETGSLILVGKDGVLTRLIPNS